MIFDWLDDNFLIIFFSHQKRFSISFVNLLDRKQRDGLPEPPKTASRR